MSSGTFHSVPRWLWLVLVLYSAAWIGVAVWLYQHFLYTNLDLGIFDQVVWNTAHGRWFAYSFEPYSYLVDHREWLLVLLAPLYWVAATPVTLLCLQVLALASGAVPFYLISHTVWCGVPHRRVMSVVAVCAYLLSPLLTSMLVYEFHILPLAIPLTLWLWWALLQRRWRLFWSLVVALLLVREDVGLMVCGVGVLLLVQQQWQPRALYRRHGVWLIVVSTVWTCGMIWLGAYLSPAGAVKFSQLYAWLGATPAAMLHVVLQHPWQVVATVLGYDHSATVLLLLAVVSFLPLLRPVVLLPLTLPALLYLLIDERISAALLHTHDSALLLPWLYIGALYGYARLQHRVQGVAWAAVTTAAVVVAMLVGTAVVLGPYATLYQQFRTAPDMSVYQQAVRLVQPNDSVMASDAFYPHITQRQQAYPIQPVFTGRQHFSDRPYTLPARVDALLLDRASSEYYQQAVGPAASAHAAQRFDQIIAQNNLVPVLATPDVTVLRRAAPGK